MEAVKPRKKHRKKAKHAATGTLENEETTKAVPENDKLQEEKETQAAGNLHVVARPEEEESDIVQPSEDLTSTSDTLQKSTNGKICGENVVRENSSTRVPSLNEELDTVVAASVSNELVNESTSQTNIINSDISSVTVNTHIDELQNSTSDIDNLGATVREETVETKSSEAVENVPADCENEVETNEIEQVATVGNEIIDNQEERETTSSVTDTNTVSNEQSQNEQVQSIIAGAGQVITEGEGVRVLEQGRQDVVEQEIPKEHESVYPKLSHSLTYVEAKESTDEDLLEPFTEDELKMFYFNPLLEQLESFTDRFLVISNQNKHEFYELVNNYFKSRNALTLAIKEFKIVHNECNKKKEHFWIVKDLTSTAQGKCQDHVQVTHTEQYQQVELNKAVHGEIENSLKVLEKALYETLCLQMYTCQLARMRINSYIHDLISKSSTLSNVFTETDVGGQSPPQITIEFQSEVQQLRDCISVLFMFVRQPLQDQEFADNLHHWTEHLVSVLLRVASLADLVFIVNHVMRCPPGFPSKVASFVQFPVPHYHDNVQVGEQYFWDNPLVHHFVAMLAAILLPVRGREQFLEKMIYKKPGTMRSISWTLLDEHGEEDEDPEDSWMLFQESDLVDVFGQFPFDAFFRHLFRMDPYLKGEDISEGFYSVEKTTSRDIMRMLAFASCIVNIMGNAFQSYQNLRYRGFVKRIGRTIRQVVQYVLDHWSNYRSLRVTMCGDSYTCVPDIYSIDKQFSLQQLQTEVDQFFMRATQQIISAHNLGAWQFLADMPFNSVSTPTLWNLFWALHTNLKNGVPQLTIRRKNNNKIDWRARLQDLRSEFTDQLSHTSQSEAIFLLTTFANMATSRESHEKDFVEAITLEVFEVSFISDETREFCSKTGRDLLGTIAGFHPFIFTLLLQRVLESITTIGKACLYMFNGLPIHLCHPTSSDMDIVRGWLLKAELSSPEHQLARHILQNLNWGCVGQDLGETDSLFLERSWHRAVAVMLVEASALRLPNRPGGISHDAFKDGGGLIQQVTLIAASSYSRLMQQNNEQIFADWLWEMMLLLRLHDNDLPTPAMGFRSRSHAVHRREGEGATGFAGQTAALSSDEPLDLYAEKSLVNIVNAIKANGPLGCYVSIAMTMTGSNTDMFISDGLHQLSIILNDKCFDAVLRICYSCLPMFLSCPDKLVDDNRFTRILHRLCQLDGESAYYAEKLLLYPSAGEYSGRFAGIIQSHIEKSHFRGSPGPVSVIEFWMKSLCSLPNWYKDGSIQYLLDSLLKASVKTEGGLAAVKTQLIDAYKTVLKQCDSQGILSSLWSLVSPSSTGPPQLWDIKPSPDYSYYAYYVISTEDQMEENSGLRVQMAKVLIDNPDISVDYALKKVSRVMKLTWSPHLSRLCMYRWANQTLATAMDHPILPLVWQRFFRLYLERPSSQPGMPQRSGVGYRYFDSQADVSLLKRMKQRLQTTAEHHRGMTAEMSADKDAVQGEGTDQEINKQFEETKAFHEKLASFYQVLALWLDEPRLHDPTLYLPSLPPPYDPQRLEKALRSEQEPWWDLVYFKKIDWELIETVGKWMKHAYGTNQRKPSSTTSISSNWGSSYPDTAAARIVKRMRTHQPPRLPPPVVMIKSPIPPLTDKMLTNKQKINNIVHDSLQKLGMHAKHFCRETDHLMALDQDYLDLIPRMSTNQMTQLVKRVPCRSKFRSDHVCSGPATMTLQFLCRYDNQVVSNRMNENRREYDTLVEWFLQACPMDICFAAAFVEMIITVLVKKSQLTQERHIKEILTDIGTSLFYQLAGCMDETVIRFQPTLQFFSSCIEILGKEFILNNGYQTEQLLCAILEHTSITMLLVPFFSPNDNPSRFTAMYHEIMQIPDKDLAFSLLTKFDLEKWLSSSSSSLIERSGLTVAVFTALRNLGLEVNEQDRAINEVYLRHMSLVLMFNFPEQYSDTLRLLFEGSSSRVLSLDVWEKFLFCIGCVLNQDSDKAPQSPTLATVLADEQVMETLDWLTTYFTNQRAELGGHVTGGLYTMWRPYIKQLSLLLGFMCQQVVGRTARQSNDTVQDLEKLWKLIHKTFEPWICAQDNPVEGNPPVAPWNETEVPQSSDMVALFTDTMSCLHLYFPIFQSSSSLMNMFWPFFVTSLVKPGIPDYVRRVHHSKFFSLPWNQFNPTPDNIDLMLKLQSSCQTSFQFLGCVFPMINWDRVITTYCENQSPNTVSRVLTSVFHLFLMFTNDKTTMETQGSEMPKLLERAHFYPWQHIDTSSFDEIVTWEVEHCKAELILEQNSSIWHAIRLTRAAAGITSTAGGSVQPLASSQTVSKRVCYVLCIASLLVKCSSNENLAPSLYHNVIEFVLRDIESIAGTGNDHDRTATEVCLLLSETLNLLNNCAPVNDVTTAILDYILEYLKSTTSLVLILASIPAACRSLANIRYMVSFLETGIEEVFARHSSLVDVAGRGSHWGWNQVIPGFSVPELSQDSFIEECIQQSASLTLYAYVLLRLSQCQSSTQEMVVLTDLVSWCGRFKVRKESEYKITLFWHKTLQLALRQADFSGSPLNNVAKQLSFLAMNLHLLGEDKESSGLLGAIGFGRKSTFTVNFRFMARVVEAFILAQLPSNTLLRLEPKAPGYVREPSRSKQHNESGRVISSTNEAELALSSLESLRSNKQYHIVSSHITDMHSFIANPLHSLREGPKLVARLAVDLYPGHSALNIMN